MWVVVAVELGEVGVWLRGGGRGVWWGSRQPLMQVCWYTETYVHLPYTLPSMLYTLPAPAAYLTPEEAEDDVSDVWKYIAGCYWALTTVSGLWRNKVHCSLLGPHGSGSY